MQLVGIITGLWFIGIIVACCVITRKVRKCSNQLNQLRETAFKDAEV